MPFCSVRPRVFLLAFTIVLATNLPAQELKSADGDTPQSSSKGSKVEAFEQYLAYWTSEPGWQTELQLRNNLDAGDLTVTAAVRTVDGVETELPPVKIGSGDVVSLDLSGMLPTSAPKLVGGYGSLVLRYSATVYRALYAAAMIRMNGQPIAFHLDAYPHPTIATRASREGIWWLPREAVSDFLVLSNSGNQKLQPNLTLYDSSGKAWQEQLSLGPRQTQRLSVRTLLQQAGLTGSYGGIKIDGADTARYLESAHLLFDQQGGFSANMKMFSHNPDLQLASHLFGGVKEWTTRAPMLALSEPDPALGFPAGTTLQPQVFVRNTSVQTFSAHIYFSWRSETASGKTAPINLPLKPNATQLVDVAALQAQKVIPPDAHWAAVVLSAPVQPDDLMAVAASYDQTGRYGAQTPFSDQLASHWEAGKWEVDSTHDSLVTIGNGGNKPTRAGLTILYNHGSGRYQIEQALAQDEQFVVDFGKLIRNQIPDKDGHTLPPDLTSGTYRLRDLNDSAAGTVYEGKVIVDKTYGHAAYGCMICCGPIAAFFEFNPLGLTVGGSDLQQVQSGDSCGGGTQTITGDFPTWWTDNTAIATANKNKITGVGVGKTMHHAKSVPMYWGLKEYASSCPLTQQQPGGNTNVQPTISGPNTVWWFNGQNPAPSTYPTSVTLSSSAGSSTSWSVSQQDAKVNLSSTTGAQITITSTGSHFSAQNGDISITATANGASSAPFTMTARAPWKLSFIAPQTFCNSSPQTYSTELTYNLIDNLSGIMSTDIGWSETVGTSVCENGSNWCTNSINKSGGFTNPVTDILQPPELNSSPAPQPTPICNGQSSGTKRYRSIPQTIYVGNTNSGGVKVQSDTLGYYIDHGQHDSIQSPSQPPQ